MGILANFQWQAPDRRDHYITAWVTMATEQWLRNFSKITWGWKHLKIDWSLLCPQGSTPPHLSLYACIIQPMVWTCCMKALPFFSKYCNASSMRTASSTERPRGSSFTSWCRTIPDLGKEFVSVLSETQVLVLEYPKTLQVKCGLSCLNTFFLQQTSGPCKAKGEEMFRSKNADAISILS